MVSSGPDARRMTSPPALERLLRRDRIFTLAGVVVLCLLAWAYIVMGAGFGMNAGEMLRVALFPHTDAMRMAVDMDGMSMEMMAPAPARWTPALWALTIGMWWAMMIAMMSPAAAPTILLYARVHRHALAGGRSQDRLAPTGAFLLGYLLVWFAFSLGAAALQWMLIDRGVVSPGMSSSQSRWLSAGVLIAAGFYQLSPLKAACLAHCRDPAAFLSRHWRPHAWGAVRLGILHGGFCVGCCWLLMTLLFVGGVMNLVWIAALAILVLVEKLMPPGRWIGQAVGLGLIAWGIATLFV